MMENSWKLYSPILPVNKIGHDGTLRTIAFCYNANIIQQIAVATSPEEWWSRSFQWRWATTSRQSRLGGGKGQQAINKLINAVDGSVREELAKANLLSQKLGVKNLAMTGESILERKSFAAQPFDGKSFLPRYRCSRCRLTFGIT